MVTRNRHLFARVTVLVAVNSDKPPAGTQSERATRLRRELPAGWDNVSVAAWAGLTVEFCRERGAGVINASPSVKSAFGPFPRLVLSEHADHHNRQMARNDQGQ